MSKKDFLYKLRGFKKNFYCNTRYNVSILSRIIKDKFSGENTITNQKEIRVVGLRRSGNHAIVTWIRRHYPDYVWHLNNVYPKINPYHSSYKYYRKPSLLSESLGDFSVKDCLIMNYENCFLEDITDHNFEAKHDLYFGKSKDRYDVLILRDPFNMLASMYVGCFAKKGQYMKIPLRNSNTPKEILNLWLRYAREFLGESNYLTHNKVSLNYNEWCINLNYRQKISHQLDLQFCDEGFNVVKGYGGGSSFEGKTSDGQASQMNTIGRWYTFLQNEKYKEKHNEYKSLFNSEIYEYSEKIFGHIEGTEKLID